MRESSIEQKVCDWAKKQGVIALKLSGPNAKGQPDRMFIGQGKVVFIEFKAPGKKPTALQAKWLDDLTAMGFNATGFDSSTAAIDYLKKHFPK